MILLLLGAPYIEIPYPLGKLLVESTVVTVMRVEKVDKQQNAIIYRKVQDLKGVHPTDVIKHNIGRAGFHEREWKTVMEWAEPGKLAVFLHNGGASETCIDTYWYQAYAGGEWWNMSHADPYLLRTFAGRPEKLALAISEVLAGREVIVPSMIDGDKNALQLRTAKVQRMRASLKIQEYNPQRDFVGWGNEDYRRITGLPGFTHQAGLSRVDPGARGIAANDFDGDGDVDFCLFGENKTALVKNEGSAMNELALPYGGAARGADWADYNGDGKPDLLLAAPTGPRLLTNAGETFRDDSAGLPARPYYTVSAAAWIDYDGDKRPDILLANGFLGLRLYRNLSTAGGPLKPPALGPWHVVGPFDNGGIAQAHAPEKGVDLKETYAGKGGAKIAWQKKEFPDAAIHSLAIFNDNNNCVAYLAREIEAASALDLPVSLGSDDSLVVLLNGQRILTEDTGRAAAPDQNLATLHLKPGKNMLLLRIGQGTGDFAFYFAAKPPAPGTGPLFEDVTQKAGLGPEGIGGQLKGDHLAVVDVNRDGRSDFLFSGGTGLLVMGSAQGFVAARDSGISYRAGGISPAFGDMDDDGDLDLFVPQKERSLLLRNDGGKFTDVTAAVGDLAAGVGGARAAAWVDLYKSGRPDLLIGCIGGPNRFFRNGGGGKFKEAGDRLGLSRRVFNSRAVAAVDLNKDGTADLLFNNEGQEPVALLGDPARTGMRVEFAPEATPEPPKRHWARAALATTVGLTVALAGAGGIAAAMFRFRRKKK